MMHHSSKVVCQAQAYTSLVTQVLVVPGHLWTIKIYQIQQAPFVPQVLSKRWMINRVSLPEMMSIEISN